MRRNTSLVAVVVSLILSAAVLRAEATITTFYDKNFAEQKLIFRCVVKGLEAGNRYRIAVGSLSPITMKDSLEIPQGAKMDKEEKKFLAKDIARIEPSIKELNAQGFEINVQEVSPQAEVRAIFDVPFKEIEKLKAGKSPLFIYVSRQFAPDVFYMVDYYQMDPSKLVK
ncbi:MAG TPA: fibronectin type III domain-containing protein [Acidobacteriota bacterium]|jgi:hypothetical protein|nr:fibronectin type III domain-containing protein [Acidobacteriota bacterium]